MEYKDNFRILNPTCHSETVLDVPIKMRESLQSEENENLHIIDQQHETHTQD